MSYEYVEDSKKIRENEDRLRIVFLKTKDPIINGNKVFYKFAGIFKKKDKVKKIKINGTNKNFVVLEKQNDEIILSDFIKS